MFLFMNYERTFGACFILVNLFIIIALIYHAVKSHKSFLNIYRIFFVVSILEAIIFLLLGVNAFLPETRNSSNLSLSLLICLVPWMILSLVLVIFLPDLHRLLGKEEEI